MTRLIDIITETLNELVDVNIKDLKSNNHNLPIVYQLAFADRVESIFRNGYSREYAGSAGGNAYCTGVYSTFDLNSTIDNSRTKASLYGDTIVKLGIKSYERFFICDKRIAQQVYGSDFRPSDQLKILFKDYPQKLEMIMRSKYYRAIVQTSNPFTSENIVAFCEAMGGMSRRCDKELNQYDIRGFVFMGHNDGKVTIIRDFKAIVPLAYSKDHGKTWNDKLLTKRTMQNSANDYDPIIFLGKDADKYLKPESFRVINGYVRVRRKSDHKYNLLDKDTKKPISPIWFDNCSNMESDGFATAVSLSLVDDGSFFYVNKYGCYESKNQKQPSVFWDELV